MIDPSVSPVRPTIEDAYSLLIDLVGIESPSGHEGAASAYLVDWMRAHGAVHAQVDAVGNAIGEFGAAAASAHTTIVLLGHIDTFGGALPVRVEGRTLYGRGAVDAKGALCTFAAASASAHLPDGLRVVIVGAVEEEAPTSAGARHVVERYRPDLCLIGEPSRWDRITLGYKGRLILEWSWAGGLGHSAGPTVTAGERAVAYWTRVQAYADATNVERAGLFARLDTTLQAINTGSDGVMGWGRAAIGLRLPPGLDPAQVAADLASDDGTIVQASGHERAFLADKDNALTRALRAAIRDEGGTPAFVTKTGTSDMNIVGPLWACPVCAYGPGDSVYDHTPDEQIDLDEYARAVRVLTNVLERL